MEVQKIWFDEENVYLKTKEGEEKSLPLSWFPKLQNAGNQQRGSFELSSFISKNIVLCC